MTMIKRINLKLKFVTFYKGGKIKFMKIKKNLKMFTHKLSRGGFTLHRIVLAMLKNRLELMF